MRKFQSTAGDIHSVAINHDGKKLLVGTSETKAILWDIPSGKQACGRSVVQPEITYSVDSVAFSPDDRKVLAAAGDARSSSMLLTERRCASSTAAIASHTPSHSALMAGGAPLSGCRDWPSNREVALMKPCCGTSPQEKRCGHIQLPRTWCDRWRSMPTDGDSPSTTTGVRSLAWDMETGKPAVGPLQMTSRPKATSRVDSEEETPFSPRNRSAPTPDEYRSSDGRWTVRAGKHNTVLLKDQQTSKEIKDALFDYDMMPTIRAAFSTKTSRIAVADTDSVHIFDPATGRQLATLYSLYGGRDWLVTTPGGFCTGSSGGLSSVRVAAWAKRNIPSNVFRNN